MADQSSPNNWNVRLVLSMSAFGCRANLNHGAVGCSLIAISSRSVGQGQHEISATKWLRKTPSDVLGRCSIFKNFTKFDELSIRSLEKLALILHDIYGSFDIVLRALMAHDAKSKSQLSEKYLQNFS